MSEFDTICSKQWIHPLMCDIVAKENKLISIGIIMSTMLRHILYDGDVKMYITRMTQTAQLDWPNLAMF